MSVPRIDVEWLAFTAGLKPAIRISADESSAPSIVDRFSGAGASVITCRGFMGEAREAHVLIYVATSVAAAERLRDIEAPLLKPDKNRPGKLEVDSTRELGLGLGYPPCCVDAFTDRLARRPLFRDPSDPVDDYAAARAAWVARPDPKLNTLLLPIHARLITFEPCSYRCSHAIAFADGVLELALRHDRPAGLALLGLLGRDVVIATDGTRAVVHRSGDGKIRTAQPLADLGGTKPNSASQAFASAVIDARASADGTIPMRELSAALLVAFGGVA